jgi:two-component system, sensor histidine kinase and response regulator
MTKILVIEDVHYLRNDVVEMLKYEGFDVRGAENGRVGVEVAREFMPNLIICDIMMPELDGYGVLDEIRADPTTTAIPFIFLTAKTDRTDVRQGMSRGAEDYLTKPFLTSELLETIRARLKRADVYIDLANKKLDELRTNITTALPHELRTPLNTIIGFSDMMMIEAGNLQPEQTTEWARHINQAALRLYRLVENYLTYVRVETIARDAEKSAALKRRRTSDANTVIEFQAMSRAQQSEREEDLVLDLEQSDGVAIAEADLNKVVDELLDNAFKFSEKGQKVTVEGRLSADRYELRIIDSGRGMTEEQITAIGAYMQFDRWFYEQQGTGLGLVIAKRLVEIHGGSFQVTSDPGAGTCVKFTLPLAAQAEAVLNR